LATLIGSQWPHDVRLDEIAVSRDSPVLLIEIDGVEHRGLQHAKELVSHPGQDDLRGALEREAVVRTAPLRAWSPRRAHS
jgi:hypothetical protein